MNPECKDIFCKKINDFNHKNSYRHMCKNGLTCRYIQDFAHSKYFFHRDLEKIHSEKTTKTPTGIEFNLISKKKSCPNEGHCKLLDDRDHKESYYHSCRHGKTCKSIVDDVHINRFTHPCPEGKKCSDSSELHGNQFIHFKDVEFCKNPKTCKITDKNHLFQFRHFCMSKDCSKTDDEEHKNFFVHHCKFGDKCSKQKVEDHVKNFVHPCKYQEKCNYLISNDIRHIYRWSHDLKCVSNDEKHTIEWPKHWGSPNPPKINSFKGNHFKIVQVASSSTEYQQVATKFGSFLKNTIISIERIENYSLWISYANKHEVLQKYGKEVQLYHGTSATFIPTIAQYGFDFRISRLGGSYGGGTYFSPDAAFSHGYTKDSGIKKMFFVRVTLGDSYIT